MQVAWDEPSLLTLYENTTTTASLASNSTIVTVADANVWTYLVIEEPSINVPHPIHLHGSYPFGFFCFICWSN